VDTTSLIAAVDTSSLIATVDASSLIATVDTSSLIATVEVTLTNVRHLANEAELLRNTIQFNV
jgi:hypothetical protein